MALITCPECGKQISDKAEICVGCGYPIAQFLKEKDNQKDKQEEIQDTPNEESVKELDVSLDELYSQEKGHKVLMIKKIREKTSCSLEEAHKLVDDYWREKFPEKELHYTPKKDIVQKPYTVKTIDATMRYDATSTPHRIRCPRCGCTEYQIVGTKKKFSVGKAFVGNAVGGLFLGPVGALAGTFSGVHGKDGKTKFICNQCGSVWERKI